MKKTVTIDPRQRNEEEEVDLKKASDLFETQVIVVPMEKDHFDHADHNDQNDAHNDHQDGGKHGDEPLTC